jgi:hypothetical protein
MGCPQRERQNVSRRVSNELESANQIIGHSDYNVKSRGIQRADRKIPTGSLRFLGVKALDLYE